MGKKLFKRLIKQASKPAPKEQPAAFGANIPDLRRTWLESGSSRRDK